MPDVDLQRLVVSLEANIKRYERKLAKAHGVAQTRTRAIESRFKALNRGISNELASLGRGLAAAFTVREIGRAIDQYTRIQNALRVAGLEGAELASVYEQLFEAAQRNAAPLESLVTLYGRVAQVQGDLNTNSGELIRFSEGIAVALRVAGTDASQASGALLQLSQALASGTVRAEEFNSINEGALPILQAVSRGLLEAGGNVGKLRQLVTDGKVSSEAFFRAFLIGLPELEARAGSTQRTFDQAFTVLQNGFVNLVGALDDSIGASSGAARAFAQFGEVLDGIAEFVTDAKAEIQTLVDLFSILNDTVFNVSKRIGQFNDLVVPSVKSFGEQIGLLERAATPGEQGEQKRKPLEITVNKPISIKDFKPVGSKSGASKTNEFDREIQQIKDRTQALIAEAAAVGLTTRESEKSRAVLELEQAARRANIPLTDANKTKIAELAAAYADASATLEDAQTKFQQMNELQSFIGGELSGFFSDIISGSGNARAALQRLVSSLADAAIQAALLGQGPLAGLFGTTSKSGGLGGLFGALFNFGGGRATGGPVVPGQSYIVGERGKERFVPTVPGRIVPGGGSAGPNVTLVTNVAFNGDAGSPRDRALAARQITESLQQMVDQRIVKHLRTGGMLKPVL